MRRVVFVVFVLLSGGAFGCDKALGCHDGEMRCMHNVSQICGTYGWEDFHNCSSIGETCYSGPAYCSGFDIACCQ
jgi:hypothetical protein